MSDMFGAGLAGSLFLHAICHRVLRLLRQFATFPPNKFSFLSRDEMEAFHFLKKPNKTEPDEVSRSKRTNGTNARSLLDLNNSTRQQNCSSSIAGVDEWQILDFHQPLSLCAEWRGTVKTQACDRHTVFHFFLLFFFFCSKVKSGLINPPPLMQSKKLYPPHIMFHPASPTVMASQIGLS